MAQRDCTLRGTQLRLARCVETFEHLGRGEVRQQLSDRRVERKLALLDKLHGAGGRDRLGHRSDPEHAVERHGIILGEVAFAERALVDHLFPACGDRDNAGNFLGLTLLTQNLIDLGFALHGVLLRLLLEVARSSSRSRAPASMRVAIARSRDGRSSAGKHSVSWRPNGNTRHNLKWKRWSAG